MTVTRDSLGLQIVAFYRSWRLWTEQTVSEDAAYLVLVDDLCTTPTDIMHFESKEAALAQLNHLIDLSEQVFSDSSRYSQLTIQKLKQSYHYLRNVNLDQLCTKKIAVSRGSKWVVPNDDRYIELVHKSAQSAQAYAEFTKLDSGSMWETEENPVAKIDELARVHLKSLRSYLPYSQDPKFEAVGIDVESPWANLVVTKQDRFELQIYTSRKKYNRGFVDEMALHEVCGHIFHFSQLKHSEELQHEWPHLLCIAIHTQDSFYVEAIAQFMHGFVAKKICGPNSFSEMSFDESIARHAAYYNNTFRVMNQDLSSLEAATAIHMNHGGQIENLERYFASVVKDPFLAAQRLVYYPAIEMLLPLLELPVADIVTLIPQLLQKVYDADSLSEFANEAMRDASVQSLRTL